MNKRLIIICMLLVLNTFACKRNNNNSDNQTKVSSEASTTYWAKTYGGSGFEFNPKIAKTNDGQFIIAVDGSFGLNGDFWVFKIDDKGSIIWQKSYGGTSYENIRDISVTEDNGCMLVGSTESFGAGNEDFWILKLNSSGAIEWQRAIGGVNDDRAMSVATTSDGYIVAGYTYSFGNGWTDYFVVKLSKSGDVQWQKSYGGDGHDNAKSVVETGNGSFLVIGISSSFSIANAMWIIEIDASGSILWQKTYTEVYEVNYAIRTSDGNYLVAGFMYETGAGWDSVLVKFDANGLIIWQRKYGASGTEQAESVVETSDGGYLLVGRTDSFGFGGDDISVIKLQSDGSISWQKAFGGSRLDFGHSILQLDDGKIMMTGTTSSFGTIIANDVIIIKTAVDGSGLSIGKDSNLTFSTTNIASSDTFVTALEVNSNVTYTNIEAVNTNATIKLISSD
ncbi:MAG: hypothetical protein HY606_00020 [Planctomycetes bacterium]|nr:hypothetical protein [Planctomycetota bacterium]